MHYSHHQVATWISILSISMLLKPNTWEARLLVLIIHTGVDVLFMLLENAWELLF